MKPHSILGCVSALLMASGSAAAQGPATRQAPASAVARPVQEQATTALQDARSTLARLTEHSMTQDAREALGRVSTSFSTLYKAYTGEEPDPRKTAAEASARHEPSPNWRSSYDVVTTAITAMIGPPPASPSAASPNPTGTSGSSGPAGRSDLTGPVRADLQALRDQLARFQLAAGGKAPSTAPQQ